MAISDLDTHVTNEANQPDLNGNLFPVGDELDVADCVVTGELPAGLNGAFIRNGPNPMFEPRGRYHMFDGDGMLHGITFDEGRVSYRNRWIRSRGLDAEMGHGRAIYSGLGEVMEFPSRELTGDAGPVKNPSNTHIVKHAGRLLSLWEGGLPTEVTADLETVGEFDFDGKLRGAMTAHPRIDPETGEMLFFAYSLFPPYMKYYVADSSGRLVHAIDIDLPAPVMMHDCVNTEEHTVFLDSPIVFNMDNLGNGPMVEWKPENGTRLGVMPRLGSADDLKWFDVEAGHIQHFWSAWADGDRIEGWGSKIAAPDFGIDPTTPIDEQAASSEPGRPARFWIDLAAGTAGWEEFDDMGGDFCRMNDEYNGVRSRYGYMSGFQDHHKRPGDFDTIVKYDETDGARTSWWAGEHGHVGESVFAPDPDGSDEDDGWLINAVHDSDRDVTNVLVLDAKNVEAGPIASVEMPRRIPFGFHANWFPSDA